jgi:hypothetical protein
LLWLDSTSRRSEFDRLKSPAKAATLSKFKLRLVHLQYLDALGETQRWLAGIQAAKIAHFAGEARVTDVGDLRAIGEAKRWTLLASLIHESRMTARDEVATMFCKRMAAIHKKGRDRLEELREAHRAESERLLDQRRLVAKDTGDVLRLMLATDVAPRYRAHRTTPGRSTIRSRHSPGPRVPRRAVRRPKAAGRGHGHRCAQCRGRRRADPQPGSRLRSSVEGPDLVKPHRADH